MREEDLAAAGLFGIDLRLPPPTALVLKSE